MRSQSNKIPYPEGKKSDKRKEINRLAVDKSVDTFLS
tara:strand:- start:551 stop:661 length:111 start_codon:yes stop_codon:yes gene_type:complete